VPALLDSFLDPATPSLKVCGITIPDDAEQLAALGVPALGVNFWPQSKRYCPPESAAAFLHALEDRILRVGVFVNADPELPARLFREGLIDLIQFHGDETPADCAAFATLNLPFIKAIGVDSPAALEGAAEYKAQGLLLDAHAPGIYGGTGQTIDWVLARDYVDTHPQSPLILAGGITPENAAEALAAVRPAALDVASGSESEPGIKDFNKVSTLLAKVAQASSL
jgi:phosphoribosylanthranilate isomerase